MRGAPLTRAASANGRWAYTLYDGAGKTPFVHALDTSSLRARCIDLSMLAGTDLSGLHLRLDGAAGTLTVTNNRQAVVIVDTRTFQAHVPVTVSGTAGHDAGGGMTIPWMLLSVASSTGLALGGAMVLALRRYRRSTAVTSSSV